MNLESTGRPQSCESHEATVIRTPPMQDSGARVGYVIGGCALTYAVFFLAITTTFETNDDVSMMLMGIGFSVGGEPSEHWYFTSLLISKPVAALYRVWPMLPWYALYLYTFHFLASCILVFVALRRLTAFPLGSLLVCLGALVSIELLVLTRLQFTSVAFVLAIAAIALWVHACLRGNGLVQIATAGLLFGLAYNVRTLSTQGALLLMLPVVVLAVVPALSRRRLGVLLAIPVAVAVCALRPVLQEQVYGKDPAWQSYLAYNAVRGRLHHTPKLEPGDGKLGRAIATVGWSPVDLYMFKHWFFTDRDVFSQERLERFLEARRWVINRNARGDPVRTVWWHVNQSHYLLVLATALALALCQSRRSQLLHGAYLLWGLGVIVYLILLVRFPPHVSIPIALCLCVGFWLLGAVRSSTDPPRRPQGLRQGLRAIAIATAGVILAQSLLNAREHNAVYSQYQAAAVTLLRDLERIGKVAVANGASGAAAERSPLFVIWGGYLPLQSLSPWVTTADLPDIEFLGLGTRTHSPPWNAVLEAWEIERLPPAIFQRDDILLIADPAHYPVLIDYVRDHYNLEGRLEPIGSGLDWKWEIQVMRGRLDPIP